MNKRELIKWVVIFAVVILLMAFAAWLISPALIPDP
jgi:hypothetical protein